ncbi:MAG: DUF2007 domain-containing protein [Candidatus Krumholzibacteriia bacterium]
MTDHPGDLDLRTVLESSDLGLIAIVEGILEGNDIRYLARGEGIQDLFGFGRLVPVNPISGPVVIQVAPEDEEAARDLLADLVDGS